MIVTLTRTMKNNVFKGVVTTTPDIVDLKYCDQFGEPQIDTVGNIPIGEDTFVLAGGPRYVKVVSGMPIEYSVDANTDDDAQIKVDAWMTEMKNRIVTAMDALKIQELPSSPNVTFFTA